MPARTIYLIKRVETEVTSRMNKVLTDYDLTPAQYIVINFVHDHPDDLSSAQLSRRFLMTPQSMNEIIMTLQRKKLVEKYVDPDNRRILRINLTSKGKEMLESCNQALDVMEAELLAGLSAEELETFRNLLGRFLATTHQQDAQTLPLAVPFQDSTGLPD